MIARPYCAEQIQPTAKKCKHRGEWLDERARERNTRPILGSGSMDARAVAKGIKDKERDRFTLGCGTFFLILLPFVLGFLLQSGLAFLITLIVSIILIVMLFQEYFRE